MSCTAPIQPARVGGNRSTPSVKRDSPRSTARPSKPSLRERKPLPPDPFFSGEGLDRADHLRATPDRIRELHSHEGTRQLVWNNGAPAVDERGKLRWEPIEGEPPLFLGLND